MNILISGASGYLGSRLVESLSSAHNVVALIRSSSSTVRLQNLPVSIICHDKEGALDEVFRTYKPEIIINTVTLYGRNDEPISALIDANIGFPIELLALAKKYRCKVFINTGTSLPDDISSYALTKNTFVKLAKLNTGHTLKFINVALEHFYGPSDNSSKFTSYVINQCLNGEDVQLTNGNQRRDFIYIDDVLSAYKIILSNLDKLERFETIPLGSGTCPTVREFVETVHSCIDTKSKLEFGKVEMRENELMHSCADISRLSELGWVCVFSLVRGVECIKQNSRFKGNDGRV
tara:strand:- start:8009 stop:8884 length:876 start_codon:yes stop_codon:yes gene_type:complete